MATLSRIHTLTREESKDYSDVTVNEIKQPAQIFTIQLGQAEKIDVLMDDFCVGVYYQNGDISDFLYILMPCRANRYMMSAMWDYLDAPYNWFHFEKRSWKDWKDYFLDVGFLQG